MYERLLNPTRLKLTALWARKMFSDLTGLEIVRLKQSETDSLKIDCIIHLSACNYSTNDISTSSLTVMFYTLFTAKSLI